MSRFTPDALYNQSFTDLRIIGYRWLQNGTKLIPKQDPQISTGNADVMRIFK